MRDLLEGFRASLFEAGMQFLDDRLIPLVPFGALAPLRVATSPSFRIKMGTLWAHNKEKGAMDRNP